MLKNLFAERGLSLDRLKSLIEVAEAGGISKAVHGDPARQSLYSRQIKELEEFFGVQLTRKKGKGITLSTAGEELVNLTREYFSALSEFRTNSKNIPRKFVIGAGDSIHNWIVSPVLSKIAKENKPWLFTLRNLRNNEVAEMLYSMEIDFGILRRNLITADVLKYKTLSRVRYAMYIPKNLLDKKFAKDYKLCLKNIPCATLSLDSSFANMLKNACASNGIDFKITLETQSFPFAAEAMKTKAYMAILPEMCENTLPSGIVKIQPSFFKMLERDIVLAWNPRLVAVRPSVRPLIDYFVKELGV